MRSFSHKLWLLHDKPGSLVQASHLRHNCWYCLWSYADIWENATGNIAGLYCRHASKVELKSVSQAWQRLRLRWPLLLATSVLMSEWYRWQYWRLCRRQLGSISKQGYGESCLHSPPKVIWARLVKSWITAPTWPQFFKRWITLSTG